MNSVLDAIVLERARQEELFPGSTCAADIGGYLKLAVLTEEVGEVARELCDAANNRREPSDNLITELIQVAAVAVAWAESLV